VDNVTVTLEHVDLLDGLDGLHIELLERCLQFLVIGTGALVDLLDLSAWCTFPAVSRISHVFRHIGKAPTIMHDWLCCAHVRQQH